MLAKCCAEEWNMMKRENREEIKHVRENERGREKEEYTRVNAQISVWMMGSYYIVVTQLLIQKISNEKKRINCFG